MTYDGRLIFKQDYGTWKAKSVRARTMPVVIPTAIKTASTSYIMLTLGIIVMNTFHFILSLSYHSKTDRLNQSEGAKKDKVDGKFPVSIPDKTHTLNSKLTS